MSWMLKQFAAAMLIIAAGLCASAWGQASAPATRPSTQTASSDMSSRPVGPSEGRQIESGPQSPWTQWFRTLAALALVVVLIVAARFMLKRFGPVTGQQRRDMLDVLARTAVSPRHQLLLVRLGRRVVLVGQAPTSLTTLSEITDADEVASIIEAATSGVGLKKIAAGLEKREGGV
jgi:flagellar protein FliO/FliZ